MDIPYLEEGDTVAIDGKTYRVLDWNNYLYVYTDVSLGGLAARIETTVKRFFLRDFSGKWYVLERPENGDGTLISFHEWSNGKKGKRLMFNKIIKK